jgi:hypothetical protein
LAKKRCYFGNLINRGRQIPALIFFLFAIGQNLLFTKLQAQTIKLTDITVVKDNAGLSITDTGVRRVAVLDADNKSWMDIFRKNGMARMISEGRCHPDYTHVH